jgi:hypothetical protein
MEEGVQKEGRTQEGQAGDSVVCLLVVGAGWSSGGKGTLQGQRDGQRTLLLWPLRLGTGSPSHPSPECCRYGTACRGRALGVYLSRVKVQRVFTAPPAPLLQRPSGSCWDQDARWVDLAYLGPSGTLLSCPRRSARVSLPL